jgi:hypothetical protein
MRARCIATSSVSNAGGTLLGMWDQMRKKITEKERSLSACFNSWIRDRIWRFLSRYDLQPQTPTAAAAVHA